MPATKWFANRASQQRSLAVLLLALSLFVANQAGAASLGGGDTSTATDAPAVSAERSSGENNESGEEKKPRATVNRLDAMHSGISSRVEQVALRIDSFFADDRFYADATESYARISGQTTWENGEDTSSQARLRVLIDLPGTRQRLRLFIEGDDPNEGEGEDSDTIPDALDDNDYNIGLESQFNTHGKWDIRPAIGVKASTAPDPFVRLRAIRYEQLGDWLMRFTAGVAEFVDDGTEVQTRVDFDYKIKQDLLFRSISRARYRDSKDRIDVLQQFTVFQKLNSRVGLAYDVGLRADDDPDWEVDHYFTQLRARFRAYRKWFFIELKPQVVFREEDDYDPSYLFSVRADVVFGERYH